MIFMERAEAPFSVRIGDLLLLLAERPTESLSGPTDFVRADNALPINSGSSQLMSLSTINGGGF